MQQWARRGAWQGRELHGVCKGVKEQREQEREEGGRKGCRESAEALQSRSGFGGSR